MPNLRGASPVDRDERGRSYTTRTNNISEPDQVTSGAQGSPRRGGKQ